MFDRYKHQKLNYTQVYILYRILYIFIFFYFRKRHSLAEGRVNRGGLNLKTKFLKVICECEEEEEHNWTKKDLENDPLERTYGIRFFQKDKECGEICEECKMQVKFYNKED